MTTVFGGNHLRRAFTGVAAAGLLAAGTAGFGQSDDSPRVARRVEDSYKSHKLAPVLQLARESQDAIGKVKDYEASFQKRELIGKQLLQSKMHLKLRERPFSVYLRYVDPHPAREVLFVDGKYKNELLVHDSGLKSIVGTVSVIPTGKQALEENRYPVTKIGLANMLDMIVEQWESELKYDEVDVKYFPNAKIGDVDCKVVQVSHPVPRRHFRFHMTRLYIDSQTSLPIRVEQFNWPTETGGQPQLVEEYTYLDLKTNVGLSDGDFDPKNPAYGF